MASRHDRRSTAGQQSRSIRLSMGAEIRNARRSAGLSLVDASHAVGISHSQLGRIERGVLESVTVEQLCLAASAVGMKVVIRAYPVGDPVRDAAHLALLSRFRLALPPSVRWRTEVPLPIEGDLRAWDAILKLVEGPVAVEAETRLHDLQGLERRIALKERDGGVDRVILLVADTAANRRVLRASRAGLRVHFPLDGRQVLAAIRAGRPPEASGIVVM